MREWRGCSVTQYEVASACRRKWYLGAIEGIPKVDSPGSWRGQSLHAAIRFRIVTGLIPATEGQVDLFRLQDRWGLVPDEVYQYPIWEYATYVQALEERGFMPDRERSQLLVEHWFRWPALAGPGWRGVLDLVEVWPDTRRMRITDWKGHYDVRKYSKTPDEMRSDIQCCLYALWALDGDDRIDEVEVRLVNIEVKPRGTRDQSPELQRLPKPPKKVRTVKVAPVEVTITRARALEVWRSTRGQQEDMLRLSAVPRWEDVPPDTSACDDFGGCQHRELCGIPAEQKGFASVSFLGRYQKKDDAAPPPPVTAAGTARPNQVVPDDAPPRDAYVKEEDRRTTAPAPAAAPPPPDKPRRSGAAKKDGAAALEEHRARLDAEYQAKLAEVTAQAEAAARKRVADDDASAPAGTPTAAWKPVNGEQPAEIDLRVALREALERAQASQPNTAEQKEEAKDASPSALEALQAAVAEAKEKAALQQGTLLLVGCLPTKGVDHVLLEDWVAPVIAELNADVMREKNVPHYQLLGYGETHAALALAVAYRIRQEGLPPVIACADPTGTMKDVVSLLVPHCRRVIRRT